MITFNIDDFQLFYKYNAQYKYFNFNLSKETILNKIYYSRKIPIKQKLDDILLNPLSKILILLHGNYSCNLNCIYCEHHILREQHGKPIMTEELAKEVIDKIGPAIRELTWHGGEPTLLPSSLLMAVENEKKKKNFNFKTTFQTNGILLTDEKIEELKQMNIHWGFSFDGIYNDRNRGPISTKAALRIIDKKLNTGFITVYLDDTVNDMIKNYEYYKTIGVRGFQSCVVRENVGENTNVYLTESEKGAEAVLKYLEYWIHDTNNPIVDSYLIRQLGRVLNISGSCEEGNCIGGWLIVDPLGNIGFCGHDVKKSHILNIKDINSIEDLLNCPQYLSEISKQERLMHQCQKTCPLYYTCYAGCLGNDYEYNSNYMAINPRMCKQFTLITKGVFELIKNIDLNDTENYNPLFLNFLKQSKYISLNEIKEFENKKRKELLYA